MRAPKKAKTAAAAAHAAAANGNIFDTLLKKQQEKNQLPGLGLSLQVRFNHFHVTFLVTFQPILSLFRLFVES